MKGKNRMDEKKTAYHEAGHVVVSYQLGLDGYEVSIASKNGTAGRHTCETIIDKGDDCEKEIIALYVGYAAEKALYLTASPDGSCDDNDKAQKLLEYIDKSEEELRSRAAVIVDENWITRSHSINAFKA